MDCLCSLYILGTNLLWRQVFLLVFLMEIRRIQKKEWSMASISRGAAFPGPDVQVICQKAKRLKDFFNGSTQEWRLLVCLLCLHDFTVSIIGLVRLAAPV